MWGGKTAVWLKIEEKSQWLCVLYKIILSCNLRCYTLMRILEPMDREEEPKSAGEWTMISQRFITKIHSPGARSKLCGERRKSKTGKVSIPQKHSSQQGMPTDACNPTTWKDAGGRLPWIKMDPGYMTCSRLTWPTEWYSLKQDRRRKRRKSEGREGRDGGGEEDDNKRKQNPRHGCSGL